MAKAGVTEVGETLFKQWSTVTLRKEVCICSILSSVSCLFIDLGDSTYLGLKIIMCALFLVVVAQPNIIIMNNDWVG